MQEIHFTTGTFKGDFDDDEIVNFVDFAVFALAWSCEPGDLEWNPACDISAPYNIIDELDLAVFCENWLAGVE